MHIKHRKLVRNRDTPQTLLFGEIKYICKAGVRRNEVYMHVKHCKFPLMKWHQICIYFCIHFL